MKVTYTIEDLPSIATMVLSKSETKVPLFHCDMGVAKTRLVKELARKIGVQDSLIGPSFSMMSENQAADDTLFHNEFCSIQEGGETLDNGIEDYFESPHWNYLEWPDKIPNLLPDTIPSIQLKKNPNGSRTINLLPVN